MRTLFVWGIAAAAAASTLGFAFQQDIRLHFALHGGAPNPPTASIVMLGDSHTEIVNWPLLSQSKSIANLGIHGNTTEQIKDRIDDVLREHPHLVILMAGTNDALTGVPTAETLQNIDEIEREIRSKNIDILTISPPPLPSNQAAISPIIQAAAIKVAFDATDLLPDQIHLRRSGYAKWWDAIAPTIQKYCAA